MNFSLDGKTALVYGAAQGIGFASARMLAQQGANVILADVNEEKLISATERLKNEKLNAACICVDVKEIDQLKTAAEFSYETFGSLNILLHSVGILYTTTIEDTDVEQWDTVMKVNLRSAFFCVQKALPYLKKSKNPRVIFISSLAGRMGGYNVSMSYSASKGGMLALTMGLARQLAPYKITVNSICPSTTMGEMAKKYTPEVMRLQEERTLLKRIGTPEDMAAAVCYLASDEAGFVTGATLDVNGGTYVR